MLLINRHRQCSEHKTALYRDRMWLLCIPHKAADRGAFQFCESAIVQSSLVNKMLRISLHIDYNKLYIFLCAYAELRSFPWLLPWPTLVYLSTMTFKQHGRDGARKRALTFYFWHFGTPLWLDTWKNKQICYNAIIFAIYLFFYLFHQ